MTSSGSTRDLWLRPRTLRQLRAALPEARIVSFSADDMCNPDNQSSRYLASLPLYGLHVTTKSHNVAELEALGARDTLFLDNSYDPAVHRPIELSDEHQRLFREGIEAEFFGSFDELVEKCRHYLAHEAQRRRVAEQGHRRCVFGSYSNEDRLLKVLDHVMDIPPSRSIQPADASLLISRGLGLQPLRTA